jgi:hypothetical protein
VAITSPSGQGALIINQGIDRMQTRIFKYQIDQGMGQGHVVMPSKHDVICVANQAGKITLWAEVDVDSANAKVPCAVVATGESPPPDLIYVGTAFMGIFVFHVYLGDPQ